MAIDVCSEISSAGISPRISFSYDLNCPDVLSNEDHCRRSDLTLLDSSSDFVFCIGNRFAQELAPADELFSNGKIRAKEIIKRKVTSGPDETSIQSETVSSSPRPSCSGNTEKKKLKEFLFNNFDAEDQKPPSKSFWQFNRSSSLNFDSVRSRSLIRSLQFLSRSNSTGSVPNNSKQPTTNSKGNQKPHLQKQPSVSRRKSSASSPTTYYSYSSSQRPCNKIKNCGAYADGVRISPVLNFSPPCISRVTVSFFGFGSLFCNGKAKKKKK